VTEERGVGVYKWSDPLLTAVLPFLPIHKSSGVGKKLGNLTAKVCQKKDQQELRFTWERVRGTKIQISKTCLRII